MRKTERSDVKYPMWRKKVDSSFLIHNGTTIPMWVCDLWNLDHYVYQVNKRSDPRAKVSIIFNDVTYEGAVTFSHPKQRANRVYRLWYTEQLNYEIKQTFIMSYIRYLESALRKDKTNMVENEVPFWEFLDIEYDFHNRRFIFKSYYTQKSTFPALYGRLINSPALKKLDDELNNKSSFRIYKQDWKQRDQFEFELGAENVIYTLVDTKNSLIYVGEAKNLNSRFRQGHTSIKNWDFYRYDVLPKQLEPHRKVIERMIIRDYATLFNNTKQIESLKLSNYTLVNDRIDK